MKIGLVLVSYPYNQQRVQLTTRCMISLAKTNVTNIDSVLQITYKESPLMPFSIYEDILGKTFKVKPLPDEQVHTHGQSQLSTASANILLDIDSEITHVVFMYDDFIYNPAWLQELVQLINRHSNARAWSVYRSSYTYHHQVIAHDGTDTLVTMHDGVGCVTREEWEEYNKTLVGDFTTPDFRVGNALVHGGCTFDIHHAKNRPGDRWTTSRDYWENLGIHNWLGRLDQAIDFVGE